MKLLNKILEIKPQPFRMPNRYELILLSVIACLMYIWIPEAQLNQRQKVLEKRQQYTLYVTSPEDNIPQLESPYKDTDNIIESEPKIQIIECQPKIQIIECQPKSMYVTTLVNIRNQPSLDSEIVTKYSCGRVVIVKGTYENWSCIGDDLWVCSDYLTEYNPDNYIDIGLDYQYQDLVRECISTFGLDIDEYFVYGLIYVESRFNPEETSNAEACGLMQLIPGTWRYTEKELYKNYPDLANKYVKGDAFDVPSNIVIGIYHLKMIQDKLGVKSMKENSSRILTCYNRGVSNATRYYSNNGTYITGYSQDVLRAADFIRTNRYWEEGI